MLRRLALRDFVIVRELEVEFDAGFTVLTGETGAGKSILIDALQLALGSRADGGVAGVVREGAQRAEISAEFDLPGGLTAWLEEAGFEHGDSLLLRRTLDATGKSRAWINGSPATVAQLREAAERLVDIHGQHAWQSLTRPAAVRALLDAQAGVDAPALAAAHAQWKAAEAALERARSASDEIERERDRLAWQINEVAKLAPGADEWPELNAEHQRLAHAQALLDGARTALDAVDDGETSATSLTDRALDALSDVQRYDEQLAGPIEVLQGALAQLQDAARTLNAYLGHADLDPERLAELDERLSAWMSLARRYRTPPEELPALLARWQGELRSLDAATDLAALEAAVTIAERALREQARKVTKQRQAAARPLADAVTQAMQTLGMAGGRFEVALLPQEPLAAFGAEQVEFQVAGHAGSTPRALAKVASGGELSRLALAIAVTTSQAAGGDAGPATLIFDEIDVGIGGAVGDAVGALMKQLGRERQVLAVTHLPQVAACGDHHHVVAKAEQAGATVSRITRVVGEARVAEVARMLGGERAAGTSLAHAQAMLAGHAGAGGNATTPPGSPPARRKSRT